MTVTGNLYGRLWSTSASPCANRLRSTYWWMTSSSDPNSRRSVTIVTCLPTLARKAAVSAAA